MTSVKSGPERYEIGERIGVGGMGSVYRATDKESDAQVAIKLLHEQFSDDPGFVARFRDEARNASRIRHPNVVQVFDYGRWDERYYIAMELIQGKRLRDLMAERSVMGAEEASSIITQVAHGVDAAHREGVVHRDLKPENVLLDERGDAHVGDFGLAKSMAPGALTMSGAALSTAQYMAPEVAEGKPATPASDVYALGIILYEMLTGEPPFSASNAVSVALQHMNQRPVPPRQLRPMIPPQLEAVVLKAMSKRPEQRYSNAAEFGAAVAAAHNTVARVAQHVGLAPVYSRHTSLFAAGLAAVLLAGVVGIAAALYFGARDVVDPPQISISTPFPGQGGSNGNGGTANSPTPASRSTAVSGAISTATAVPAASPTTMPVATSTAPAFAPATSTPVPAPTATTAPATATVVPTIAPPTATVVVPSATHTPSSSPAAQVTATQ
jgi:serine/threonine-protein kinase